MSENKLDAELRSAFGKGAARKIRAAGKVPAVLYGHGNDPVHLTLPAHEVWLIIRRANAVLDLTIDGKQQLALVKDVQRDPVRQILEHIDLLVVKKGEKVVVDVPVIVEGVPFSGTQALQEANTLSVEAEATNIPTSFTVSVEGLEEGTQILAGQVELPAGVSLIVDEDALVVNVVALATASTDAEGDEETAAEEAADGAAEDAAEEAAE